MMLARSHRKSAMSLVEIMIGGAIASMLMVGVVSVTTWVASGLKGSFFQQQANQEAKLAIEAINREIRLAAAPLTVLNGAGQPAPQGDKVEFSRAGEAAVRAIELLPGPDGDLATPWDNLLIFDPDTAVAGDEMTIARMIGRVDAAGIFQYAGAASPLIVSMRAGDPAGDITASLAAESMTRTGRGTQSVEINIVVAPRN